MNIDVIIPTFNRAATLTRAIDSVLEQSYQNFSLIIVDDGSTDETQNLLQQYKTNSHIKYLSKKNAGVSSARNFGVQHSTSAWICFLDSDDQWLPQKLEKQIEYITKHPDCVFLHSEEIWIRNNVRVNPKNKHSKKSEDLFKRSLEFCLISPSTVMMKRELFNLYGPFNEELVVCEDYDLWLKILARHEAGFQVGFIEEALIKKYGGHADQLSTQYVAMDYYRIKSLIDLFHAGDLAEEKKEWIKTELVKKGKILLRGYLKHQNLKAFHEIKDALAKISLSGIMD